MTLAAMLLIVVEAVLAVDVIKFTVLDTVGKALGNVMVGEPKSGTAKCVPKTAFAFLKLCKRILSASETQRKLQNLKASAFGLTCKQTSSLIGCIESLMIRGNFFEILQHECSYPHANIRGDHMHQTKTRYHFETMDVEL